MFELQNVLQLHTKVIERYGGASGIRDYNMLDSALKRPFRHLEMNISIPQSMKKLLLFLKA